MDWEIILLLKKSFIHWECIIILSGIRLSLVPNVDEPHEEYGFHEKRPSNFQQMRIENGQDDLLPIRLSQGSPEKENR